MDQAPHLWLFFLVVFGVIVLPGLDMAYVLASALVGGRRSGLSAVGGIVAGGVVHVAMGALGIGVLLKLLPAAFNAVLLAGALYVGWIGLALFRSGAALGPVASAPRRSSLATFRQGALTCLLNPKAYLFMLAIFPQFLRPQDGALWAQAAVLGAIIAVTQIAVYGAIALVASRMRGWLQSNPDANAWLGRAVGVLLMGVAVYTGFEGWRVFY